MRRISLLVSLVLSILSYQSAFSAPPDLEKRLEGRPILAFDATVKETDPRDLTTQSPGTTYIDCRDTYTYFVEPIPARKKGDISGLRSGSPLKYRKVFHGLRVVYDEKGRLHRIENYFAGSLHGQMVVFENGKRWYEITYKYGLRDGISRNYRSDGKLLLEAEFKEEKRISIRSFKEDGQPEP